MTRSAILANCVGVWFKRACLLLFFVTCASSAAVAEPLIMTGPDAAVAQSNGELIIVDIRTPYEWEESGVVDGAFLLDMRAKSFVEDLQALMAEHPGALVAMICATGVRSEYVTTRLEEFGMPVFIDISEGMHGSSAGPGWLAHGLPVRPYEAPTLLERLRK